MNSCRAADRHVSELQITPTPLGRIGGGGGVSVSFTWAGAGRVLAEVLSREQERDLQGREGQEAALVGEIQEVETCEGESGAEPRPGVYRSRHLELGRHLKLPVYLGLSWQTAEASGRGGKPNRTLPLLCTATRTAKGAHGNREEDGEEKSGPRGRRGGFDPPCCGCRPPPGTVGGPPPSGPPCTSALGLNRQLKPGEGKLSSQR